MRAAVVCIAFNRPDLFTRVSAAIGEGGPRELFVSIDGPRTGHPEDTERRAQVRRAALSLEWPTRIHVRDLDNNLGCKDAVTSAISWALEEREEIIVLEDDCLPDPSFLRVCDELLERYRDDTRVMQVGGTNWGAAEKRFDGYSYGFTSFAPTWGWATWRRAWALNDKGLSSWSRVGEADAGAGMAITPRFRRLLQPDWDRVAAGGGEWDHQWQYTVLRNHGLNVCPAKNLVVNIGFRPDGTHLKGPDLLFGNLPQQSLELPLRHPPTVALTPSVQSVFARIYWQKKGLPARVFRWLFTNPRLNLAVRTAFRRIVPHPS